MWLVSAAPVELASLIARKLELTGALGTVSEIVDGIYTGQLAGAPLHGPAKAEAVRALAEREDLDLAICAAYSDSSNDIPMLSLVGQPVAINPDATLRRHARAMGWHVVRLPHRAQGGEDRRARRRWSSGQRPASRRRRLQPPPPHLTTLA